MGGVITLTTDFGEEDGYVGAMKGVILALNPSVTLVDISHQIAPQDVSGAAYVLYTSCPHFPPGTVHLVVIDPGVGGSRHPVALRTRQATYVAPDNGVLSYVTHREEVKEAIHLDNPRYWRSPVSPTFHGRDIFAPVAAHLSLGVPLAHMGHPFAVEEMVTLPFPQPMVQRDGTLLGHVWHIDRFGNVITDIGQEHVAGSEQRLTVEVGDQRIEGLRRTYIEGPTGGLLALVGSSGQLEIAIREGSAAEGLGVQVGDEVLVSGLD
ncbi:MAG: S-adenosyl-l-methionine hydroxide adenosyltransferase family protein [Anaerolineae bacterium]